LRLCLRLANLLRRLLGRRTNLLRLLGRGPNRVRLRRRTPLLLRPRWRLGKSWSRLKQNACCQRRSADDVPHSPVHALRLFDPSAACAVPDLSLCLRALYTARSLVNVEVLPGNINPRARIFPMPY
jgi:hypothetical protein